MSQVIQNALGRLKDAFPDVLESNLTRALSEIEKKVMRDNCLDHGIRCDGREVETIRPLNAHISYLPDLVHGSALFERGKTQVSRAPGQL